jgi:transposase
MPKQYKTRSEGRILVKSLYDTGVTNPKAISKRSGVPLRTVYRYVDKLQSSGQITDAKRAGRPRKNTSRLRRQLGQIKRLKPRAAAHVYAADLRKRNKMDLSTRTVETALHQLGYTWRLPGRKKLSSSQKAARLEFCQEHVDDDWDETWSYDEAYFNLNRHSNKCWVSVSTEESVQRPKLTKSQEKISIGICFAISSSRKSALCFLPKNWSGPDLVKVFKDTLLPSINWPKRPNNKQRFIIDNDGRHQMPVWKEFVARSRLHPLEPWPSNSPDLNPIENEFAWMKRFVEDRAPTNEQTLRQAVEDAFRNIPDDHLKKLMGSMRSRMEAAIKSKGARINY